MSTDHISAVICTRNRAGQDRPPPSRSVLANDYPTFDLTVIDQSTTDATGEVLEPIAADDPRLHYVHVDEAGLSRAYNTGIRSTTGEILAFTDDDCIVAADWITSDRRRLRRRTRRRAALRAGGAGETDGGDVLDAAPRDPRARAAEPQGRLPGLRHGRQLRRPAAAVRRHRRLRRGARRWRAAASRRRTTTSPTAPTRAARSSCCDPRSTLRHDGRREEEDWPALLHGLRHGDGALLHQARPLPRSVRPVAARPPARRRQRPSRSCKPIVRRASRPRCHYCAASSRGIRGSFKFKVDRTPTAVRRPDERRGEAAA